MIRIPFPLFALAAALSISACAPNDQSPPKAKRAEAAPAAAAPAAAAMCEEHHIAEAMCPFCNPALLQTLGFCEGHGVPEALCYQCNPALVPAFQAVGDWCAGHERPESQCYLCNPERDPAKAPRTSPEAADNSIGALTIPEELPRSQRPPTVRCSKEDLVVHFDSADIADAVGLEFTVAERRVITQTVECNARIVYDGRRYTRLASQVEGVVTVVHRDLGDAVRAGDALVTITSAELAGAKAGFLEARAALELASRSHERQAELAARELTSGRELLEAETVLSGARIAHSRATQELLRLGLSHDAVADVAAREDTSPQYVLTAPFAGVIVERDAAPGEVVDPEHPLVAVADPTEMWAEIDVFESDMSALALGQPVVLTVDGLRGQTFAAEITWIAAQVDPRTRTLEARAEVSNAGGVLKANQFAHASVAVREGTPAIVVPVESVQWEGCCNVVFVKQSEVLYEPRKVHLGVDTGTVYEVLSGLREGEQVVTQGAFLLKTELLKGSIGAGCCEVEPGA